MGTPAIRRKMAKAIEKALELVLTIICFVQISP